MRVNIHFTCLFSNHSCKQSTSTVMPSFFMLRCTSYCAIDYAYVRSLLHLSYSNTHSLLVLVIHSLHCHCQTLPFNIFQRPCAGHGPAKRHDEGALPGGFHCVWASRKFLLGWSWCDARRDNYCSLQLWRLAHQAGECKTLDYEAAQ